MSSLSLDRIIALAGISLLATNICAQQIVFSWVDENGVVHYGDSVPPEYSRQDRELLNLQGITIGKEQGEITPEERAAIEEAQRIENERLRAEQERRQYDQMLLDTYLAVSDIENLRDRRLELLDAQVRAFEIYLNNLHKKREDLEKAKQRFAPLSDREDAPPVPENLQLDIQRAESQIQLYEKQLEQNRANQEEIRRAFESDIARFRQLKGLDA